MKTIKITLVLLMFGHFKSNAQILTEITNKRIFEHHSSMINDNSDFGENANGIQSGYDFTKHTYFPSFDQNTFGAYTNGEEKNLDLVEHNGPFGNGGRFGFTSNISSIWDGEIVGNAKTKWVVAPSSFNYYQATNPEQLKTAFESVTSSYTINNVDSIVYLAQIRESNMYVAIRCYNIKNIIETTGKQNVYFDFDYKYGKTAVGLPIINLADNLKIYPNPTTGILTVESILKNQGSNLTIVNVLGVKVKSFHSKEESILDLSSFPNGLYFIYENESNLMVGKFIKN